MSLTTALPRSCRLLAALALCLAAPNLAAANPSAAGTPRESPELA